MTMKMLAKAAVITAALVSTAALAEVSVTTGAGYTNMVKQLTAAYGGKAVENYGGNIGQMLAQVSAGNGVNLVISDLGTLKNIKTDVKFSTTQELGKTPLVFVWGKNTGITGSADIAAGKVKQAAMPDPKSTVYGRAARAWLKGNHLASKISGGVLEVSTVPQVIAYVAKGEVDAGFVNRTAARGNKEKLGGSEELTGGYAEIQMVAVVVEGAEKDADVQAYLKFLATPEAKAIMKKHGID